MWHHLRVGKRGYQARVYWQMTCQEMGFQGNENVHRSRPNAASGFGWKASVGGRFLKYQNISFHGNLSELFCFLNAKML